MKKKTQDAGNGEQGTGSREWKVTRRGWLGALAAVAAAIAGPSARTEVPKARRRRFWIGHS